MTISGKPSLIMVHRVHGIGEKKIDNCRETILKNGSFFLIFNRKSRVLLETFSCFSFLTRVFLPWVPKSSSSGCVGISYKLLCQAETQLV